MTKYTSNEQYEKDKARFIADIKRFSEIQKILHGALEHREAEELADLLKQSKWIGADSPIIINNQPVNQPCTLLKDVDTTTVPN